MRIDRARERERMREREREQRQRSGAGLITFRPKHRVKLFENLLLHLLSGERGKIIAVFVAGKSSQNIVLPRGATTKKGISEQKKWKAREKR